MSRRYFLKSCLWLKMRLRWLNLSSNTRWTIQMCRPGCKTCHQRCNHNASSAILYLPRGTETGFQRLEKNKYYPSNLWAHLTLWDTLWKTLMKESFIRKEGNKLEQMTEELATLVFQGTGTTHLKALPDGRTWHCHQDWADAARTAAATLSSCGTKFCQIRKAVDTGQSTYNHLVLPYLWPEPGHLYDVKCSFWNLVFIMLS